MDEDKISSHAELKKCFQEAVSHLLEGDPLLSDLHPQVTLEEVRLVTYLLGENDGLHLLHPQNYHLFIFQCSFDAFHVRTQSYMKEEKSSNRMVTVSNLSTFREIFS